MGRAGHVKMLEQKAAEKAAKTYKLTVVFQRGAESAMEYLMKDLGVSAKADLVRMALEYLREGHEKAKADRKKLTISFPHDFV